jgi:hypothetical protein
VLSHLLLEHLLEHGLDASSHSSLHVQLEVTLELMLLWVQVPPFSLETHKLPDTVYAADTFPFM